ncbi:NAD-dependent DNA ligase LigA [Mycoplasma sp. CSL7503-lung]|uniref:NAD-dependent DNA ligase LigA n=1 Tax=Mycoplasma sp. CSL7503-lung TaxID=536372 RepID=UPI0021D26B6F|nr:NAD-dependent DNA ligase LigA [Mycoplasma sp. CSL7503-lung]MCU4706958.1 NAD-dependent DNA ligase LigA [Mycoplasma sp. CSL7503-lung]
MEEKNKIQLKIKKLVEKINKWNYEYFQLNEPSVEDLIYDKNLQELLLLEKQYPQYILENSPTLNLGSYASNKFSKFVHKNPMLSLEKAYSENDLLRYYNNLNKSLNNPQISFCLEPKIDGLSISLHYSEGKLIRAITRGDGTEGEDVTENVIQIKGVPLTLNQDIDLEVRGEIYMSKSTYNKLNEEFIKNDKKIFANPRNAASGTLRQLDKNIVKERNLSIILYDLVNAQDYNIDLQSSVKGFLENLGFPTNKNIMVANSFEQLIELVENFRELKNEFEFDCDGYVIKLNQIKYWEQLGKTSKFPKYAIAFKYETQEATSIIKNITASVGRTGKITYIANFDEVNLNQTNVNNATMHNYEYIKNLNVNIGDQITIIKSGEIIPKVIGLSKKNTNGIFDKILNCPSCGELLVEKEGFVDQFCVNQNCEEQIIRKLIHFVSKKSMNIETLGEKNIRLFYQLGYIKNIEDIYSLKKYDKEINQIPGFKSKTNKKLNNILNSIEASKNTKLFKALFSIGIPNVGIQVAQLITNDLSKLTDLFDINLDKLTQINTIGEIIIESIREYIKIDENRNLLEFLDNILIYEQESQESNILNNLSFVITGTLSKSRDYFKEIIEKNGGKVSSPVSSKTSYLLYGENAGSKYDKALKLKIKLLTEEDFRKLINK